MDVYDLMVRYNGWWKTGDVSPEIKSYGRRHLFNEIMEYMDDRQVIAVTGLRRTGKTTLLHQVIGKLIKEGVNPGNIMYFSFDETLSGKPELIEEILETYGERILKSDQRKYIFFDEVHYISKWQSMIKRYYDMDIPGDTKFFISGSASLNIKKAKESLAGRIYDFTMTTLSLFEFIGMRNFPVSQTIDKITEGLNIWELNGSEEIFLYKQEISAAFNEYVIKGGFPEVAGETDIKKIHKYIKSSVVDKIVFLDISKIFSIKEPGILMEILKSSASHPGQLIEYNKIADSLSVSRQTISNYILYLEESFLVKLVKNYTLSYISGTRKAKKIYPADHGITNALQGKEVITDDFYGKLVESIIACSTGTRFFWRKKYEVDVVLETDGGILPIEVKYTSSVSTRKLKGPIKFMDKFKVTRGIVITKDKFMKDKLKNKDILYIPAWLFLLIYR